MKVEEGCKLIEIPLLEDNPGDVRLIREFLREVGDSPVDLESADRLDGRPSGLIAFAPAEEPAHRSSRHTKVFTGLRR